MLGGQGPPAPEAEEVLHLAAFSAMTILALDEAREREAVGSGFGFIEELRHRDLERGDVVRGAARVGSNLEHGAVAIACDTEGRKPREAMAVIARECPGAVSARFDGRVLALLPASPESEAQSATLAAASRVADRLRSYGRVGLSSFYADPAQLRRAIHEAELVLEVASSDERVAEQLNGRGGSGVYRLLFRALASHPEEVRAFYEDTVAAIVGYDRQYHTDLLATFESYLEQDCNMNATARAIYAHRHTVAYRLQRVKELTGLDPMISEDRERLGLGLKAYRIVAPGLPR
jgi:sugar diacid utilization regulator